jgi:hypothetical protein
MMKKTKEAVLRICLGVQPVRRNVADQWLLGLRRVSSLIAGNLQSWVRISLGRFCVCIIPYGVRPYNESIPRPSKTSEMPEREIPEGRWQQQE